MLSKNFKKLVSLASAVLEYSGAGEELTVNLSNEIYFPALEIENVK